LAARAKLVRTQLVQTIGEPGSKQAIQAKTLANKGFFD